MANDNKVEIIIQGQDRTGAASKSATANLDKLAKFAKSAAASLAAVWSTRQIIGFAKGIVDLADETGKMAQKAGVSVEFMSAMNHAAQLNDITAQQLKVSFKELNDEIASGSSMLQRLGIDTKDAVGNLLRAEDILPQIADRFADMADGAQKSKVATELFGRSGVDLIPLLNQGSKGLREMTDEARRLGLILDTQTAKEANEFNDNLTRLQGAARGLGMSIMKDLLPHMIAFTEELIEIVNQKEPLDAFFISLNEHIFGQVPGWKKATDELSKYFTALMLGLDGVDINDPEVRKMIFDDEPQQDGPVNTIDIHGARPTAEEELKLIDDLTYAWEDHYARMQEADRGRQELRDAANALYLESTRDMFSYLAEASITIHRGLSDTLTDIITGAESASEAFEKLGRQLIRMVVSFMSQRAVAWALEKALAAVGLGVVKAASAASIGMAAGVASAWAAAATASAIATGGGTLAAGAGVPAMMATNAALGSAIALAGSLGGAAHGGLTNVPAESTFLLQRGERVLSPNQNADLIDFMRGGLGRGAMQVDIYLDSMVLARGIGDMSRDGRLEIDARAVV